MPLRFCWTGLGLFAIVACSGDSPSDPPLDPGSISVVVQLHGNGADLDDFTARAASLSAVAIHPSIPLVLTPVPAGQQAVHLEGLAPHCSTADSSLPATVQPGDTVAVQFEVTCFGGLAYSRSTGPQMINLFYLDIDGQTYQLTNGDWLDIFPQWSPDGSRLLFNSNRTGNWDIFSIRSDGTDLTPLTTDSADDLSATWSPDGQVIAYHRSRFTPTARAAIRLMSFNGANDHEILASDTLIYDLGPVWVNGGTEIAFSCERYGYAWDLCVVAPDGNGLRMLFRDAQNLRRSPNGQWVTLTRVTGVNSTWVAALDGSPPVDLTPGLVSQQANWSPDGTQLVLRTYDGQDDRLQRVNPDGTGLVPLTPPADEASGGRWSPDGARIAFYSLRGGAERIWTMQPDGSDAWPLTINSAQPLPIYDEPAWHPTAAPGNSGRHRKSVRHPPFTSE